jgi:hypothetical protein
LSVVLLATAPRKNGTHLFHARDLMTLLLTPRDVALIVQAQGIAGALRRLAR